MTAVGFSAIDMKSLGSKRERLGQPEASPSCCRNQRISNDVLGMV
jgi:hypothetical protein